ncbi:MAG: hypothetical protein KIT84_03405 [Labilithrix sp.]|nr:hypothetical protein [Labilithrix sp.]MCW5810030.1 hypothetical protein [Labilithrix sp.]
MKLARIAFALVLLVVPGAMTLASAQPAKPKPAPPPASAAPAATAEAGAASPNGDTVPASVDAAAPVAPPPPEVGDGGKWSPLNPQPEELRNTSIDAGVPVDYDKLLADVAALRARVAAVADSLYRSRVAIALQLDGDHAKVAFLAVSLDDGVVYTAPSNFNAADMTVVYDHAVAPGRHAVTVDVERKDARDESFRTSQRSRFIVDVPRDNKLDVQVKVIDDSSMGGDFPSDRSGKYDLRLRVKAVAKPVGK